MALKFATLLLFFAYGSCMEMRETVERMVMVRTTGSDLQPAATGYIYKKNTDGPVSVTKMGESEVIEHFSKMYQQPEAYKAPIPVAVGPFYAKEDEEKAASHTSEDLVKPIEEHSEDQIDGIADEDYDKMFAEYAKPFGNQRHEFSDYLHDLDNYNPGLYSGYGVGNDYGSKGHNDFGEKGQEGHGTHLHFGNGETGHYHTKKHEGYAVSKKGGHGYGIGEGDAHGKHFDHDQGYKGDYVGHDASHDKEEAIDGYHQIFDKDEFKKDNDFYDEASFKGGLHKHADENTGHGSEARGYQDGNAHAGTHYEGGFGKGGYVESGTGDEHGVLRSSEEGGRSGRHNLRGFGVKGKQYEGKSYSYNVKH